MEKATFAGGCFWCMEPPFEKLNGVTGVVVGYTGGTKENPTYEEVSSGRTGHLEAVQMTYDPSKISYGKLLDAFWKSIDPADRGGQFADRGSQYMTAIFYHSDPQKRLAEESKKELEESKRFSGLIATQILKAGIFYKAEDYHQGYSKKCPIKYAIYKKGSGREAFIKEKWAMFLKSDQKKYRKPAWEELKKILNPTQFNVTQSCSTEPPFKNEYWDNKKEGIYVDVVTGEPLFSSLDKFDSGTGWPSFTKPLESSNIVEKEDSSLGVARIEVKSKHGDSHLGHVFNDGPAPSGFRYCINSASLRFISKDALDKEGYDEYKKLFK